MTTGGDAAEQVVRLSLEGFEVAVKLSGSAAKNIAFMLAAALKQEQAGKTKGKARLTSLIKSGKELKVFSIQNGDLTTFTKQAKQYGVLYCVLRDKQSKDENAVVDIIARAEDASKIERICERFSLGGKVEDVAIVTEAEKNIAQRSNQSADREIPQKNKADIIMEQISGKSLQQKEGEVSPNPMTALADGKENLSGQNYAENIKGAESKNISLNLKPSVKEKLEQCRQEAAKQKAAAEREPEHWQNLESKVSAVGKNDRTVHKQPQSTKKSQKKNKAKGR